MIKKLILAANIVVALVAAVDLVCWGMELAPTTILWMNGQVLGWIQLAIFTLLIFGFCILPSILFLDWED